MLKRIGSLYLLAQAIIIAGELNLEASVDRTKVGLGEDFTLTVSVSGMNIGNVPNPQLPQLPNFSVISRSTSQSTNIQLINGKLSQQQTINFIYTLSPKKIGKFTIKPCSLKYKGDFFKTQPIEIEVIKGTTQRLPTHPKMEEPTRADVPIEGNLMLVATADRRKVWLGQQVIVEFVLYNRFNLSNITPVELPKFSGFWAEKLYDAQRINFQKKRINGKLFEVALLKRVALFPMTTGKLTVDPMKLNIEVVQAPRDFFDFFGATKRVRIESKPITISVLPLPDGKPEEFSGGVGNFKISASLDRNSSSGGEPINLTIRISGMGNIKLIEKPLLPNIPNVQVLDPEIKENIKTSENSISGYKDFSYPIIPKADGKHIIPPIKFAYFNPQKKRYYTKKTDVIQFTATQTASPIATTETGMKVLGSDIRYIKSDKKYLVGNKGELGGWQYLFYLGSVLMLVGAIFYRRHQDKLLGDRAYARRFRSGKLVKKRLKNAENFLRKNQEKEFYSSISTAILGFVGDRFNLDTQAFTSERLIEEMKRLSVADELIKEITEIIDDCDIARFSPAMMKSHNPKELFKRTKDVLAKL